MASSSAVMLVITAMSALETLASYAADVHKSCDFVLAGQGRVTFGISETNGMHLHLH